MKAAEMHILSIPWMSIKSDPRPTRGKPTEPTLPDEFRTYNAQNLSANGDWTRYHPWRSPGLAPVADPCGVAGAYLKPTGGGGEQLEPPPPAMPSVWSCAAPAATTAKERPAAGAVTGVAHPRPGELYDPPVASGRAATG